MDMTNTRRIQTVENSVMYLYVEKVENDYDDNNRIQLNYPIYLHSTVHTEYNK